VHAAEESSVLGAAVDTSDRGVGVGATDPARGEFDGGTTTPIGTKVKCYM
jgi:hypothetical protein